jgi:carboxymethylenebutenolidase
MHTQIEIQTEDGRCEAHAFRPDGAGSWSPVLMYMDGIGIRPALFEIAERIAGEGYYVLLPDLFYRVGFRAADAKTVFTDPTTRADLMTRVMPSASAANIMRDTEAFLAHFDAQRSVRPGPIGLTGYCMGGRLSLYAAGHYGDRVAGAASYHGSGMATDAPDSPHRLAPQVTARVYIAGAIEDPGFDDAQKERLRRALADAEVDFTLETIPARHGWVPSDTPVHEPVQAERHFTTLFALLGESLPQTRS